MLHQTRGIVLKTTKYGETSLIVQVLTEKFGLQAYMVNGVRSAKTKLPAGMFQSAHLLQMVVYHKENAGIQHFKEAKHQPVFTAIPFDLIKSSIAVFMTEVVYKTVKQQELDAQLFDFIYNSIALLDVEDENVANFHLLFLIQLSKYLGFYPAKQEDLTATYFDLKSGQFCSARPHHLLYMDEELSKLLVNLVGTGFDQQHDFSISNVQRRLLLDKLVQYYTCHLDGIGAIYSHEVLQEVLS